MKVDLHSHSTASDGALSPTALVERAHRAGVTLLALTDHDTVAGVAEATAAAEQHGEAIRVVPGIEISCHWGRCALHLIGLGIDIDHEPLLRLIEQLRRGRLRRAEILADHLRQRGIEGALLGATALAGSAAPGRVHFANWLVASGHVDTFQQAFDRHIGNEKWQEEVTHWPHLGEAIAVVKAAGGVAVLAHPHHYRLGRLQRLALVSDFSGWGGEALELGMAGQSPDAQRLWSALARQHRLGGSVGSDFHHERTPWADLGRSLPLPVDIAPIWEHQRLRQPYGVCA
ncbi:MAG TPA: PHP domain-containing protein [Pseudomonadales bacterium]|jgi:predicted metal-dependent phosphoesterase TrpH|nr:PHP domain-containing protein [Pseudomonadales bacterium]HMZ90809.1 PHP domain-containing protein [Pseudomonadales bacterium]HNC75806.1 PHP domain-containing protein [Pseudomonadales bacterium]HNF08174.1 PHP domain-containing protein [Pseudomonadales bacterium]HNL23876.1 PHP domain-containing protein [Pseudomonadales bacterium]